MYFAVRGLTLLRHPLKDVLDRLRFELASIARACAVLLCEQDVVILLAFERWVEVHKIKNGFVLDVPTQDIQIVAVIQLVFWHVWLILPHC